MRFRNYSLIALAILFVASLIVHPLYAQSGGTSGTADVYVNGEEITIPGGDLPFDNDSILVPFRAISETLGVPVSYDGDTRQATAHDNGTEAVFNIDTGATTVNGQSQDLVAPPQNINNRVFLPLRFFAETFDADVSWDADSRTATVERATEASSEEPVDEEPVGDDSEKEEVRGTYTAEVAAESGLHHRSERSADSESLGALQNGETVEVLGVQGGWISTSVNGTEGWMNGYHVDIHDGNESVKMLGHPEVSNGSTIYWPKVGGATEVEIDNRGQDVYLRTTANDVEDLDASEVEGLASSEVIPTESGYTIALELHDGYEITASDENSYTEVQVQSESAQGGSGHPIEGKTIVIDAGHGGHDAGAEAYGLKEKNLVLNMAWKVEELLEDEGVDVVMTRDGDYFVELSERVSIAESVDADSFISLHVNAFNGSAHGTETYWHERYASQDSKELAEHIQENLIEMRRTMDRGVKHGNFHVIRETTMPSVLAEIAFVDNYEDAQRLNSSEFRQQAAEAIAEGAKDYYEAQ
ncbi:N-acetylmuramoyl-L-alanine amidase [Salsuginibacillus halophilus]|uniref:N-acetylmuramoyl-L-alanine amidase n=1 Tax=Salsuginibacillus halophilus TaxID=517424 RepID=A0A2P8HQM2_9BACI|nr:N-acetylmuramoyl-L-alanine amidase [Salsuginibacillus halophilus]PSL48521.1 N-acetylmuramoyl-L-alanine amidase [Salsuginibacillus halophilus]